MSDIARLRWQCRRGMLELDAIFQPFFDRHFLALSEERQAEFARLLTCSDQDLFAWFIGSVKPHDPAFVALIQEIKFLLSKNEKISRSEEEGV